MSDDDKEQKGLLDLLDAGIRYFGQDATPPDGTAVPPRNVVSTCKQCGRVLPTNDEHVLYCSEQCARADGYQPTSPPAPAFRPNSLAPSNKTDYAELCAALILAEEKNDRNAWDNVYNAIRRRVKGQT